MRSLTITLLLAFWTGISHLSAQNISIEMGTVKQYNGGSNKARIDFISASPDLLIDENNGETVNPPTQRNDGKYVYTCICDVTDTNKFGFNISVKGGVDKLLQKTYIEEGESFEYIVDVTDISIGKVNLLNLQAVVPEENIARIYIKSNNNKLIVESTTGEKVTTPVLNAGNTYEYQVTYNLSTPQSREVLRSLRLIAGKDTVPYEIGLLSPKQGVELAVIVIEAQTACYANHINQAKQDYQNGLYTEAYRMYKKVLEDNECASDRPDNVAYDTEQMTRMRRLAAALQLAEKNWSIAEEFRQNNRMDSCMQYHREAQKYRNYIIKENPNDPYSREYNAEFRKLEFDRVVSGIILDNSRLDANNRNLPIEGVLILLTAYEKEMKNLNKVKTPMPGKPIRDFEVKLLGRSGPDGSFSVPVPRNTEDIIYKLSFTADEDSFSKKSYSFEYIPKDIDVERNIIIRMNPKGLNKYNK